VSQRRKLITFSDLGAMLLDRIASEGRARGAGDYLSEVMRQRYHAWQEALEFWGERTTRAELRAALESLVGYVPNLADRAGQIQRKLPHALGSRLDHQSAIALCDLALEYAAGNQQLIDALNQGDL
jgi:hypothetical protein